jgi:hypothetical protein
MDYSKLQKNIKRDTISNVIFLHRQLRMWLKKSLFGIKLFSTMRCGIVSLVNVGWRFHHFHADNSEKGGENLKMSKNEIRKMRSELFTFKKNLNDKQITEGKNEKENERTFML